MPRQYTPRVSVACRQCGRVILVKPSVADQARYCSLTCKYAAQRTTPERFWERIEKTATCWIWRGTVGAGGYGYVKMDGQRSASRAHRVAWEYASAQPIPEGLLVCHDCPDGDNPACVRNDEPGVYIINGVARPRFGHLWLGTPSENTQDMLQKGRAQTGDNHYSRRQPDLLARGDQSGARLHIDTRPRGEQHGNARITEATVLKIRRLRATGALQREIAEIVGTSRSNVAAVLCGQNWRHVVHE